MKSTSKAAELSCGCLNGHRSFGWRRSTFLLFTLATAICGAVFLPYISVVAQRSLPAFLPFISQAGGYPPETGMLAIFLIFAGFTGFIIFLLFCVSISQRNRRRSIWIKRINILGFIILFSACLGCIITAAFPVGNTESVPNQLDWILNVLLGHSIGASLILVGIVIYQFLLTVIWWLLPDTTKTAKFTRIGFCVVYLIFFGIVVYPMVAFIREELGPEPSIEKLRNMTTYHLPTQFSTSYKICSVLEWVVGFVALLNFFTMYKDIRRISFYVTLRHKTCLLEFSEPSPTLLLKSLS